MMPIPNPNQDLDFQVPLACCDPLRGVCWPGWAWRDTLGGRLVEFRVSGDMVGTVARPFADFSSHRRMAGACSDRPMVPLIPLLAAVPFCSLNC